MLDGPSLGSSSRLGRRRTSSWPHCWRMPSTSRRPGLPSHLRKSSGSKICCQGTQEASSGNHNLYVFAVSMHKLPSKHGKYVKIEGVLYFWIFLLSNSEKNNLMQEISNDKMTPLTMYLLHLFLNSFAKSANCQKIDVFFVSSKLNKCR